MGFNSGFKGLITRIVEEELHVHRILRWGLWDLCNWNRYFGSNSL